MRRAHAKTWCRTSPAYDEERLDHLCDVCTLSGCFPNQQPDHRTRHKVIRFKVRHNVDYSLRPVLTLFFSKRRNCSSLPAEGRRQFFNNGSEIKYRQAMAIPHGIRSPANEVCSTEMPQILPYLNEAKPVCATPRCGHPKQPLLSQ